MPQTIYKLKEKLLSALDSNSNVVSPEAAMEVVVKLETFPITKEILEETRVGRIVNDMRKRTQHQALAKRAKNLLRQWQRLVPALPPADQEPPSTHANLSNHSTQRSNGNGSLGISKSSLDNLTKADVASAVTRPQSPALSDSSRHSRKRAREWTVKTPAAKRADADVSLRTPNGAGLHVSSSAPSVGTGRKQKSTAELIAGMQKVSSVGSAVLEKIAANEIRRESDQEESVLPESIRRKPQKKKCPLPPEATQSQLDRIKADRVANFVQLSVAAQPSVTSLGVSTEPFFPETNSTDSAAVEEPIAERSGCATDPYSDDKPPMPEAGAAPELSALDTEIDGPRKVETPVEDVDARVRNIFSSLPPVKDPLLLYRAPEPCVPKTLEPTAEVVNRLHSERWSGVGGFSDATEKWCDWTQNSTLNLYRSRESDEVIHVLPYVHLPLTDSTLPKFEWDKDITDYLND